MKTSLTQLLLVFLFQLNFRLLAESFNLSTKLFLFALLDLMIISIAAFEWFAIVSDWQIWVYEVCGAKK